MKESSQGFAMITAFMFTGTVMALAFGMFARGNAFIIATERNQNRIVAFNMAEAGMSAALTQLASSSTYTGTSYTQLITSTTTGGYSASVSTPTDNPNVRLITTTGYSPDNSPSSRGYESKSVTAYAELGAQQNYFDFGVFSTNSVSITGNADIDSYDSSVAPYSAATAGANGDLGTDSTGSGAVTAVTLVGNPTIHGDVIIGPGGDTTTAVTTGSHTTITGTTSAATSARNYTSVTTATTSSGSLNLSGSTTLTLVAGTYHYSSLAISGTASINVTGAVQIYVDGDVSLGGNGISNSTTLPTNCLLFSSGTSVSVSGNGSFYGAIYAPNAAVSNTGNGEVYGAIVADSYTQTGNGDVHFDEALKNSGTTSNGSGVNLLAWKENNTLQW